MKHILFVLIGLIIISPASAIHFNEHYQSGTDYINLTIENFTSDNSIYFNTHLVERNYTFSFYTVHNLSSHNPYHIQICEGLNTNCYGNFYITKDIVTDYTTSLLFVLALLFTVLGIYINWYKIIASTMGIFTFISYASIPDFDYWLAMMILLFAVGNIYSFKMDYDREYGEKKK